MARTIIKAGTELIFNQPPAQLNYVVCSASRLDYTARAMIDFTGQGVGAGIRFLRAWT